MKTLADKKNSAEIRQAKKRANYIKKIRLTEKCVIILFSKLVHLCVKQTKKQISNYSSGLYHSYTLNKLCNMITNLYYMAKISKKEIRNAGVFPLKY